MDISLTLADISFQKKKIHTLLILFCFFFHALQYFWFAKSYVHDEQVSEKRNVRKV